MNKILAVLVFALALGLMVLGFNMRQQGLVYPIYTHTEAVNKVLNQISEFSYAEQAAAWHAGLEQYETPHKQLVDTGESWIALGLGILVALLIWLVLRLAVSKMSKGLNIINFVSLWVGLCLIQIPLIFRYYTMRQERFDYHPSIDTVLMPIINESFLVLVGLTMSVVIIYFAMRKHELTATIKVKEVNLTRLMLMGLWIFLLVLTIALGFQDAKLSSILCCAMMIPMVFWMMISRPKVNKQGVNKTM